jgi:hypothetical protein
VSRTKVTAELPIKLLKKPLKEHVAEPKQVSVEPKEREVPAGRRASHWAISAIILYIISIISLVSWWNAYTSIEVRYLGVPAPSPPYLGVFFLILAFVFTGIAAQIHYRG